MVFKGCQRCGGDMWVEEDIGSRLQDFVCLQCGHRQAVQAALVGPNTEECDALAHVTEAIKVAA